MKRVTMHCGDIDDLLKAKRCFFLDEHEARDDAVWRY